MDGMPARPSGGDMTDNSDNMQNIMLAKKNLGPIKTITSQLPPATWHAYLEDSSTAEYLTLGSTIH